jgi:hypothetical protein
MSKLISITLLFLLYAQLFAQKDSIQLMWNKKTITHNPKLIALNNELLKHTDPCDYARSQKAFEQYKIIMKNASKATEDSAVLMFLYFHRQPYEHFDCPQAAEYSSFYHTEYDQLIDSLLEKENREKLLPYGRMVVCLSHNDLFSVYDPMYLPKLMKGTVRDELYQYLLLMGMDRNLLFLARSEDYTSYLNAAEALLIQTENYLTRYDFRKEQISEQFYNNLMRFCLGEIYQIDGYDRGYGVDYGEFHFLRYPEIYKAFVTKHPKLKTAWFITQLSKINESPKTDEVKELFGYICSQHCPDEELEHCPCDDSLFNFFDLEKSVQNTLLCFGY